MLTGSSRLFLLGRAALEGEHGPIGGRAAQRRRIALLAVLAAYPRGISRDKLIGYLWEESDTERARKLLSEALYVLRKSLGENSVQGVGDELRLNRDALSCDLCEFTEALERGDHERATELYRGPFLDGFFVSDAPEFEQWASRERERLSRLHAGSLRILAEAAESQNDWAAAASWWRRLVDLDPCAAAPVLALMRALDAADDRAAAIQEARAHAARVKQDLDADPDARVEAFARALRQSTSTGELPERVEREPTIPPRLPVVMPTAAATVREELPAGSADDSGRPNDRRPTHRRVWYVGAVLLLCVLAITLVVSTASREPGEESSVSSASVIAVLPFQVSGQVQELREGLAQILASNLDGAGDLRAVDPYVLLSRASRELRNDDIAPDQAARFVQSFGADFFLLGNLVQTGDAVQIAISLYDARSLRRVFNASEDGQVDSVVVLAARLSARLLSAQGGPDAQLTRVAAHTTTSYAALKEFLRGDQHFRAGRYADAVAGFSRATDLDPNFALAHYRLSAAAEWNFEFLRARRAAQDALSLSGRLHETDAQLLSAWVDFLNGRYEEAANRYQAVLTNRGDDVEARAGLAEVLIHYNPLRGRSTEDARAAFGRVLDLAPDYGEARFHALELAAHARDSVRFDSLFAHMIPDNPQALAWQAVRAFTWGTQRDQARVLSQLDPANNIAIGIAAARVAAHTHNFSAAARIASTLTGSDQTTGWRAAAHLLLAQLYLADGDWPRAARQLAAAEPLELDWTRELTALYLLHPGVNASRDQLLAERERLLTWRPEAHSPSTSFFFGAHVGVHPHLRLYLLGLVSAAAGDLAEAHRYRDLLRSTDRRDETTPFRLALATSLDGHIARVRGQKEEALERLLAANVAAPPEFIATSPFYARSHDRFVIAELNRELGRTGEAARWYTSLVEGLDFVWANAARQRLNALGKVATEVH